MDSYANDLREDLLDVLQGGVARTREQAEEYLNEYTEAIQYQLIEQHKITNPAQDR